MCGLREEEFLNSAVVHGVHARGVTSFARPRCLKVRSTNAFDYDERVTIPVTNSRWPASYPRRTIVGTPSMRAAYVIQVATP
jgi:hypothetical protein